MSREPLEKTIEKRVIREIEGALVLKTHQRDYPDRVFFMPGGHCFFTEFKRPKKPLRPGQLAAKKRLEQQGFSVYVVSSVADGRLVGQKEKMKGALKHVRDKIINQSWLG